MALAVPPRHRPDAGLMRPVLVAGGGLAGAAAAAALARAGVAVTLVERRAGPADKVCGEFLSAEAWGYLAAVGLDVAALGGAPISHVRLVRGGAAVASALPFTACGLSRQVLDEALLRHAEACGARVIRGHGVQSAMFGADDVTLQLDGLGALHGRALLLATGKHELRGLPRVDAPVNDLVGLKMYFALAAPMQAALAGHVELIMFPGGYAGLQLVEGGRANFCLLVRKGYFAAAGGWEGLLRQICAASPFAAARLAGAAPLLEAPLSIARIPYGFVHRAVGPENLYRLGDQAGVIASFTGDGMAIALHSAALAVAALRRQEPASVFHQRLEAGVSGQIRHAGFLYNLAAHGMAQRLLFAGAKIWPGGLAAAARATRVNEAARLA